MLIPETKSIKNNMGIIGNDARITVLAIAIFESAGRNS